MATKYAIDLSKLKAAGVYTIEYDNTISATTADVNSLRLLVGFNKKGPFNVPVYLNSESDRAKVFGDIDTKLERKGSFFNRMASTLLTSSPILALNLLKVDETVSGPDQINYAAMSCNAGTPNPEVRGTTSSGKWIEFDTTGKPIENVGKTPYASVFDRSKFWKASEDNLMAIAAKDLATVDTTTFEHTNFLNFANVGTEEISVLAFKPENLTGFDITVKEWYGGDENSIPFGFMRPSDYISDYFVQVIAVKGNWTDYKNLSVDPTWSQFFDASGIKKSKVNDFISADGITLLGSWQGCIIPDFKDKMGNNKFIIPMINNNYQVTGLFAAFNEDAAAILKYDYDGESYDNSTGEGCWFLDLDESGELDTSIGETSASKGFFVDMVGHDFYKGYTASKAKTTTDAAGNVVPVTDASGNVVYEDVSAYGVKMLSYNKDVSTAADLQVTVSHCNYFHDVSTGGAEPVDGSIFSLFYITDRAEADKLSKGDLVQNIAFDDTTVACTYHLIPGLTRITKKVFVPVVASDVSLSSAEQTEAAKTNVWYATKTTSAGKFTYKGTTYNYSGEVIFDEKFGTCGFYLLTAIDGVKIAKSSLVKQYAISDSIVSTDLNFIPMKGLSINATHLPGYDASGNIDAEAGVEKIYSVLAEDGMLRGLCNPEMVDFRYIVDSMGYGLNTELGGKVYLARLAKTKGKCTALLNLPSMKQFATSTNPYFCDTFVNGVDIKPAFNTKYIPLGGNDELYSSRGFNLPSEDDGAKFAAAFSPYLTYSVSGKTVSVPPAADVANVFIRKFQGGDPYMMCANLNGILSNQYLTGLEYLFDQTDREALEPMGVNPIISRRGTIMIYGNQTCYQTVKSDFNKLHVRENLNTVEIEVEAILHNYNFEYNNAITRAAVVTNITPIFEAMITSGALDDYSLQCNEKNNTEDIIRQDLMILDIELEFNHAMEKIVQRITLTRNVNSTIA